MAPFRLQAASNSVLHPAPKFKKGLHCLVAHASGGWGLGVGDVRLASWCVMCIGPVGVDRASRFSPKSFVPEPKLLHSKATTYLL